MTCSSEVPTECADIVPYTSYPNTLFGLNETVDYDNFARTLETALQNCTIDEFRARWGVCNIMFPRCLLGFELQLCRQTCLGKQSSSTLISQSFYSEPLV